MALAGALLCIMLLPTGGISTTGTIEQLTGSRAALNPTGPRATETQVHGLGLMDAPSASQLPDTSTSVTGRASWYCGAGSRCTRGVPEGSMAAAAGPALRVGEWRGRTVRVCSSGQCVSVKLVDWCACPSRVIDLYRAAFSRLASPSRGVIRVEVSWGDDGPLPTLPNTTTEVSP